MTHNNSYEDPEVFTNTLSSQQVSCGSNTCTIDCSCNSDKGWYDTPSSYSARAASTYGAISKTSTYKYAKLGNQKKSCTHDCSCTPSSSTECPSGYSTGTTSCGSGKYYSSTSCTTTTTYACSPSGCSYGPTYSYPTGGKCSTCTFYESNETCPDGYELGKSSCSTGYDIKYADSTITNTRNYGTASECPTYTSTGTNRCGKCEQTKCPDGYFEKEPSSTIFTRTSTTAGSKTCWKATGCNSPFSYATPEPNSSYFDYTTYTYPEDVSSSAPTSSQICYGFVNCKSGYATSEPGTLVASYSPSGQKCYTAAPSCQIPYYTADSHEYSTCPDNREVAGFPGCYECNRNQACSAELVSVASAGVTFKINFGSSHTVGYRVIVECPQNVGNSSATGTVNNYGCTLNCDSTTVTESVCGGGAWGTYPTFKEIKVDCSGSIPEDDNVPTCPNGYFEDKPSDYFNYTSTSVGSKTCYKATSCNSSNASTTKGKCASQSSSGITCYGQLKKETIRDIYCQTGRSLGRTAVKVEHPTCRTDTDGYQKSTINVTLHKHDEGGCGGGHTDFSFDVECGGEGDEEEIPDDDGGSAETSSWDWIGTENNCMSTSCSASANIEYCP